MSQGRETNQVGSKTPLSAGAVRADMHRDEAIWKLEVMSRRGRLPGFRKTMGGCGVAAHGRPFDMVLYLDGDDGESDKARFTTRVVLERRMPAIAAVIFALTVFPGVLLTDSFMRMHMDFYGKWTNEGLQTWWWYVPLSIVSLVWAWFAAISKSKASAMESAHETLRKIAAELGGSVETPGDGPGSDPGPEAGTGAVGDQSGAGEKPAA